MDQQIPTQARGERAQAVEIVHAPVPMTPRTPPSTMTLRIYDWCPEHGAHTDPELHGAYAEWGI